MKNNIVTSANAKAQSHMQLAEFVKTGKVAALTDEQLQRLIARKYGSIDPGQREHYKTLDKYNVVSVDATHTSCVYARKHKLKCVDYCLLTAGNGRFKPTMDKRQWRQDRIDAVKTGDDSAIRMLDLDLTIHNAIAKATDQTLAVRTDTFSSNWIWSRRDWIPTIRKFQELGVVFYDYFKGPLKIAEKAISEGIDLTISFHEKMTDQDVEKALELSRLAVVFEGKALPKTWRGYPVINGDLHDLRFTEPKGVVVGLLVKNTAGTGGKAKHEGTRNDFVQIGLSKKAA